MNVTSVNGRVLTVPNDWTQPERDMAAQIIAKADEGDIIQGVPPSIIGHGFGTETWHGRTCTLAAALKHWTRATLDD